MKNLFVVLMLLAMTGFVMAGSDATVTQVGDNNDAQVQQTGTNHTAEVTQYGKNIADVEQVGSTNEAYITQGQSGSPVTNFGTNVSWKYGAFIKQDGSDNDAAQTVRTNDNGISIYQKGDRNDAVQDVYSYIHKSTDWNEMGLDIDQIGNDNYSQQKTIKQFGSYGIQKMVSKQEGNMNSAFQYSIGGKVSEMRVVQVGNNNTGATAADVASTTINPLSLPWGTEKHPSHLDGIDPVSNITDGVYTQYQNGMYSTAKTIVTGSYNKTTQAQEWTDYFGAAGSNTETLDIFGDTNASIQGQFGEYNESYVSVSGSYNQIATSQKGDSNFADVDLLGASDNNVVGIDQTGDSNSAIVSVNGANNMATVIQQP